MVGGLFAKFRKQNVLAVLDIGVLGFLIGQAIGRWGNFVNQEAFGGPTSLPWGMVSENTWRFRRIPLYILAFFMNPCGVYWDSSYFIFYLQNSVNTTDKPFIISYLVRNRQIFIEALRTDSLYVPYLPIKVSQLVAVVTILAGIVLLSLYSEIEEFWQDADSAQVMAANVERVAAMNPYLSSSLQRKRPP